MTRADLYKWRNFHNFERKYKNMECKVCNKRTTVDTSVGKSHFIVCNKCFNTIVKDLTLEGKNKMLSLIFRISDAIESNN